VIWKIFTQCKSSGDPFLISTSAKVQKNRAFFPRVQQLQEDSHLGENTI